MNVFQPAPASAPREASVAAPASIGGKVRTFLDLIKFAHSIFALPFAALAAFWALRVAGEPRMSMAVLGKLLLILACMALARTWAMTFNRLVDRQFDAANPRTAKRPSVTGAVSVGFMAATLAICAAGFLLVTGIFWWAWGNAWPVIFAAPVLAWLAGYSLTKRFTALCHFWLGASLGLAPVCVWVALRPAGNGVLDAHGLAICLLGIGVAFWVAGFDILYALQDEAFDRGERLHSIPAKFGRAKALLISRGCHLLCIFFFAAVGVTGGFHSLYWAGFACAAALLVFEQSLVSERDISKINVAFMTANGLIGLLFGALAIADTFL